MLHILEKGLIFPRKRILTHRVFYFQPQHPIQLVPVRQDAASSKKVVQNLLKIQCVLSMYCGQRQSSARQVRNKVKFGSFLTVSKSQNSDFFYFQSIFSCLESIFLSLFLILYTYTVIQSAYKPYQHFQQIKISVSMFSRLFFLFFPKNDLFFYFLRSNYLRCST